MLIRLIPATLAAAALIFTPVDKAEADTKDVIIGAIVGGAVIAGVTAANKRKRQRERAAQRVHQSQLSTRSAPTTKTYRSSRSTQRSYVPSIPATSEGREVQTSLNYFGFNAGTVDGRIGRKTRTAISGYQSYMGYPATGTLTAFERHVLTQTYLRAEAGGAQTFGQIARLPDGARGLLRLYRQELAGSALPQTPYPALPGAQIGTQVPAPLPYDL